MSTLRIKELSHYIGQRVIIDGWLYNKRTSGKIQFPIVRDGSGYLQCVVVKKEVGEPTWDAVDRATQESTIRVDGIVRAEPRAPGGVELGVQSFELISSTGQPFDSHTLDGHIWVANFIYTTCDGPCPMMSHQMRGIQNSTAATPEERIERGLRLDRLNLSRTFWLHCAVVFHLTALASAGLELWLQRRGARPLPRLEMHW